MSDDMASSASIPRQEQEEDSSFASISSYHKKCGAKDCQVQGALILANLFFGIGSVVGALGLPLVNPLTFALAREVSAGLILLLMATISNRWYYTNNTTTITTQNEYVDDEQQQQDVEDDFENNQTTLSNEQQQHHGVVSSISSSPTLSWRCCLHRFKTFFVLGFCIFGSQAGFIVGVKMAGPIAASVWQPSQPIMTAAICMVFGWEERNKKRAMGVFVAFAGCVAMVLLSNSHDNNDATSNISTSSYGRYLVGNGLFFINCLCSSIYVISSKAMLSLYRPLNVTAWSYNVAAMFMLIFSIVSSTSRNFESFLCPECRNGTFHLPASAYPALAYYVIFTSVGSYSLLTWANQFATGTLVMIYSVLQPVASALLSGLLLQFHVVPTCEATDGSGEACLDPPSLGTLCGMIGVFVGLSIVTRTEPKNVIQGQSENAGQEEPTFEAVPLHDD